MLYYQALHNSRRGSAKDQVTQVEVVPCPVSLYHLDLLSRTELASQRTHGKRRCGMKTGCLHHSRFLCITSAFPSEPGRENRVV